MINKIVLCCFIAICLVNVSVEGKTFSKCELARELVKQGYEKSALGNWVCLVQAESGFRTDIVGKPNKNKSVDYGLFQINDKYWCAHGKAGKDCNVSCENLLKDDITLAARCAQKIFKRHGYKAWYGWRSKCEGKALPSTNECF